MPNILDKTDKSLTTSNSTSCAAKTKVERYKWTTDGTVQGSFFMIKKCDLNIDGAYQRDQVSKEKVMKIARDWDWLLLGVLSVIRRADGSLWVFDGGHRARAAYYRDDIVTLPCIVHNVISLQHEAKAFVARNTMQSSVSTVDRYKASVVANEPNALKTKELLGLFDLTVSDTPCSNRSIKCIGAITDAVSQDMDLAVRVMGLCIEVSDESRPVSASIFRGMFLACRKLEKQGIDLIEKYGDRLRSFSQRHYEIVIKQRKMELGKGGLYIEACGIMDVLNKGRRKKLRLDP